MIHRYHHCRDPNCGICNGGLKDCDVCGGAEASLPTDCPGVRMSADDADAVQAGHKDFVNGEWVTAFGRCK